MNTLFFHQTDCPSFVAELGTGVLQLCQWKDQVCRILGSFLEMMKEKHMTDPVIIPILHDI